MVANLKKEIDKAHHMTTFSLCQLSNFLIEKKRGKKTKVGSIERPKVVTYVVGNKRCVCI